MYSARRPVAAKELKFGLSAAIALITSLVLVAMLCGCSSKSEDGIHNVGPAGLTCWSADGKYLFCMEGQYGEAKLYRCDTKTWKRHFYRDLRFGGMLGISPDNRKLLSSKEGSNLYSVDLRTHKKSIIWKSPNGFRWWDTYWVRHNIILMEGRTQDYVFNVYKLSVPDGKLAKLTSNYGGQFFAAADGSGFVYDSRWDDKVHFYDLDTGKDQAIKHLKHFASYRLMYLSKDMLIYRKNFGPEHLAEILDLKTLKITHINYCEPGEYLSAGVISPNLTMYLPEAGSSHYGGDRCVFDLPKKSVRILKQMQKRHENGF